MFCGCPRPTRLLPRKEARERFPGEGFRFAVETLPVIVSIRDNGNYIRLLLISDYTIIMGWPGVLLRWICWVAKELKASYQNGHL